MPSPIVSVNGAGDAGASADASVAALDYAARYGWPVFPCHGIHGGVCTCGVRACKDAGKHPRTPHGLKDATTDPATIRGWWRTWPDANVAMATGQHAGVDVLDVDPRHGGQQTLDRLVGLYGPLVPSP